MHRTPTHNSWVQMRARCNSTTHHAYARYGGRGITVCERWEDFRNFLEDMGERPTGTTLDRMDNDADYRPGNCRWATKKEQSNNTATNHLLHFDGKSLTIAQWSRELGVDHALIRKRLSHNWSTERALTTPKLR